MSITHDGVFSLAITDTSSGVIDFEIPAGVTIPVGAFVIMTVIDADADLDMTAVSDGRGNTWNFVAHQVQAAANSNSLAVAWSILTANLVGSSGHKVTFTFGGAFNEFTGICRYFSNVYSATPIVTPAYAEDIAFPQSLPNLGTYNADASEELGICAYSLCDAPLTVTPSSGWTGTSGYDEDTGAPQASYMQYRIFPTNASGVPTNLGIAEGAIYWGGYILRFPGIPAPPVTDEAPYRHNTTPMTWR